MHYRILPDQSVYSVTFIVVDWLPVLIGEEACRVITDSLNFCHAQKLLRVNAFVILPTSTPSCSMTRSTRSAWARASPIYTNTRAAS